MIKLTQVSIKIILHPSPEFLHSFLYVKSRDELFFFFYQLNVGFFVKKNNAQEASCLHKEIKD
jgi:hypothetical protein